MARTFAIDVPASLASSTFGRRRVLERQPLIRTRPVSRRRLEEHDLAHGPPARRQIVQCTEHSQHGSVCAAPPSASRSRSWKVRIGRWSPARSCMLYTAICSNGPTRTGSPAHQCRRLKRAELSLRVGGANLAAQLTLLRIRTGADQESDAVAIRHDLERHRATAWRAGLKRERPEEVLGWTDQRRIGPVA